MARGIPSSKGKNEVAPLTVRRITRAPLVSIHAFRAEQESETKSGEKYIREVPKLSLFFDSGHLQHTKDGELVVDEDTGESKPHLIGDGFLTLSGFNTSNMVKNLLPALGFDNPDWFDEDGNLTDEVQDSFEFQFGSNALGDDYSGAEWSDLPLYVRGGKDRKSEIEVEVLSFKIMGHELLGREVDLQLTIKDGWNRIAAYLIPADFTSLEEEPHRGSEKAAKPRAATKGAKAKAKAAEADADSPERSKRERDATAYVIGRLKAAGVPKNYYGQTLGIMLGLAVPVDPDTITTKDATTFHGMAEGDEGISVIKDAYDQAMNESDEFPSEDSLPF